MSLSKAEEKTAALLSREDVVIIQTFVKENIIDKNKAMTSLDIFAKVKDLLTNTSMPQTSFQGSLSANVRGGYIVGVVGKRKVGYVPGSFVSAEEPASEEPIIVKAVKPAPVKPTKEVINIIPKVKPEPQIKIKEEKAFAFQQEPAPKPVLGYKYAHHVWINGKEFKVYRTFGDIKILAEALGAIKNDLGSIVFDGEVYSCDNTIGLERLLTHFMGAICVGESKPILNDDSGIPVELRMVS